VLPGDPEDGMPIDTMPAAPSRYSMPAWTSAMIATVRGLSGRGPHGGAGMDRRQSIPAPVTAVTVAHRGGFYMIPALTDRRGGEWVEPMTTIAANGVGTVRIMGDQSAVWVHWLENGQGIDDMTGATPNGLIRQDAARQTRTAR